MAGYFREFHSCEQTMANTSSDSVPGFSESVKVEEVQRRDTERDQIGVYCLET